MQGHEGAGDGALLALAVRFHMSWSISPFGRNPVAPDKTVVRRFAHRICGLT